MNANRRRFVRQSVLASAGAWLASAGIATTSGLAKQRRALPRRQVSVGGRRVKTVDVQAHMAVPDALGDLVKGTSLEQAVRGQLNGSLVMNDARLRAMDEQGIDVQVVTINTYWYGADRELSTRFIPVQNEALARVCAAHADRLVPM